MGMVSVCSSFTVYVHIKTRERDKSTFNFTSFQLISNAHFIARNSSMFYDELNGPSQKCCVSANPLGHPYTVGVSGLSKIFGKITTANNMTFDRFMKAFV